ncbi:hypothetical protein CM49_06660 [Paenibacillus sp. P1XP2]|nr:hypothetical protein CM49_06660 [Paenibacillus sp. P1XP2]
MHKTINNQSYLKISITLFLIIIALLSSLFIKSIANAKLLQIITPLIFIVIFALIIQKFKIELRLKIFAFIVFCSKMILILVYSMKNDIILFPDSFNYILNLNNIINSNNYSMSNLSSIAGTLHIGHYYYMLLPYLTFHTPISIIYTNTLISSFSLLLFYRVFEVDFGRKVSLFTFIFCSFSLNILLFGAAILKDPLVLFLCSLIIYMVKVRKSPLFIPVLLSVILITIRIYTGFSLLFAIIFEAFFINGKGTNKAVRFISFISIFVIISGVMSLPIASNYLDLSLGYSSNLLNQGTVISGIIALFKFYFTPLPWNMVSNFNVYSILLFDTVAFMLLSFSLILFVIKMIRDKTLRGKFTIYIIPILIHALVLGYQYDGDSTRQRIGIFVYLIVTLGIGLLYKTRPKYI